MKRRDFLQVLGIDTAGIATLFEGTAIKGISEIKGPASVREYIPETDLADQEEIICTVYNQKGSPVLVSNNCTITTSVEYIDLRTSFDLPFVESCKQLLRTLRLLVIKGAKLYDNDALVETFKSGNSFNVKIDSDPYEIIFVAVVSDMTFVNDMLPSAALDITLKIQGKVNVN